jgi:hypothetical protein
LFAGQKRKNLKRTVISTNNIDLSLSIKAQKFFLLNHNRTKCIIAVNQYGDMEKVIIEQINVVHRIGPLDIHFQSGTFCLSY